MAMSVVSINVGLPKEVPHGDKMIRTGIFKQPVHGPVAVHLKNLAGDGQADLKNHGGLDKAVYAYAQDHYAWWRQALGREDLTPGIFGENLTVAGLDESALCVGDELHIGTARFCITQPRVPCFKLGLRFGDPRIPRRFSDSLRCGAYLKVLQQGQVETEDAVTVIRHGDQQISLRSVFAAFFKPNDQAALALLEDALSVPELSGEWRRHIAERLRHRGQARNSP